MNAAARIDSDHAQQRDVPDDATITAISPKPSDPNQRRVRVGRRTVATLPASAIERLGLEVGMRWTAERAGQVDAEVQVHRARRAALVLLGRRPLAVATLRDRLSRKDFAEPIIDRVIDEFTEQGWLDDRAFAVELAEQIIARSPCSRELLIQKLLAKSVDQDIAEQAAEKVLATVDESDQALRVAEKALRGASRLDPKRAIRRVAATLHRRGYDEDTVAQTLERLGVSGGLGGDDDNQAEHYQN